MVRARRQIDLIERLGEKNRHLGGQVVRLRLQAAGLKSDLAADYAVYAVQHRALMALVHRFRRAMRTFVLDLAGNGARLENDGQPRSKEYAQDMASPGHSLPANCR